MKLVEPMVHFWALSILPGITLTYHYLIPVSFSTSFLLNHVQALGL